MRRPAVTPRRAGLAVGVLLAVGLLGWTGIAAVEARRQLLDARAGFEAVTAGGDAQAALDEGLRRARRAHELMRQPGPWLLSRVPLLGRSLAAERDVAAASVAVLEAAARVYPAVTTLSLREGAVDLEKLALLRRELTESATALQRPLADLRAAPLGLTPGAVRSAGREAQQALGGLDVDLTRAADAVGALAGLAGEGRPRTLVVAVMNNAELRGAGGYASSIAVVTTDGGRVTVGRFQDVNEFEDPPQRATRVPAPPDYEARYGDYLANSTVWKNVLMSPHAPDSAAVLCEVARLKPGIPCDAVLLLDVPALARLTSLTGPVPLPGGERLQGEELVRALLVDAYAEARNGTQSGRRQALRGAADQALGGLLAGRLDLSTAGRTLLDMARGRHLALWSADPAEQAALTRSGLAGSADPGGGDLQLTAFNQFSKGKLDYYVRRDVDVAVEVDRDRARVTQRVTLALDMPAGLDTYVTGVRDERLEGILDIAVADAATVVEVLQDGQPAAHSIVSDTGSRRIGLTVVVPNGSATTYTVVSEVPVVEGAYRLQLLPQPLAHDARLTMAVRAAPGLRLADGPVSYDGAFDATRTVAVVAERPSWWDRPLEIG